MKKILFAFLWATCFNAFSQMPNIHWQKDFGGSRDEVIEDIKQTPDGGYIVVGSTASFTMDGDVLFNHSTYNWPWDIWVVKTDACGAMQWQRSLGGSNDDFGQSVALTNDGGYIVAGHTESQDGDVTNYLGGAADAWLIKLDSAGNTVWQKTYGGYNSDGASMIQRTSDGGFIVIAWSSSNADTLGDDDYDYAFYKIDTAGNLQWKKLYGGLMDDTPYSVIETSNGNYVAVGYAESNNGDVTNHHGAAGLGDCWVVVVDSSGNLLHEFSLGGSATDKGSAVVQTSNSSYLVAAYTNSTDGDVATALGAYDVWLISIDTSGNILWQRSYGGSQTDVVKSLEKCAGNRFILGGSSLSNDGDATGNHSTDQDCFLLNVDSAGNIRWKRMFGGTQYDATGMMRQTPDGGYIFGGYTYSNDGDATAGIFHGNADFWIVKFDPEIPISGASTICIGDTDVLSVSGAQTYTWMPGNIVGQTIHVSPSSSTTYTVYAKIDTCGAPAYNTFAVNVNTVPVVTFTTLGFADSVCVDAGAQTLTGATPAGGIYSGPGVSGNSFDPAAVGTGNYTITYIDGSGNCSDTATHSVNVKICNTTGIANAAKDLRIYPNPAHNSCTLRAAQPLGHISVQNLLGEEVLKTHVNTLQTELDLSAIPNGLYIVHTQQGYFRLTKE